MLNGQSITTVCKVIGGLSFNFSSLTFYHQTISPLTIFSWDSPALTFRKKIIGQTIVQHFYQR
ncbi:MAG: hypothetical protein HY063_10775 [Bacteroidetes bacterium]|nr:hypothetical protein [Bacteroidota bacterium]